MAGVSVGADTSATIGNDDYNVDMGAGVSIGAQIGADIGGELGVEDGKLTIGVEGEVALLVGIELDLNVTVDLEPIIDAAEDVSHEIQHAAKDVEKGVNIVVNELERTSKVFMNLPSPESLVQKRVLWKLQCNKIVQQVYAAFYRGDIKAGIYWQQVYVHHMTQYPKAPPAPVVVMQAVTAPIVNVAKTFLGWF